MSINWFEVKRWQGSARVLLSAAYPDSVGAFEAACRDPDLHQAARDPLITAIGSIGQAAKDRERVAHEHRLNKRACEAAIAELIGVLEGIDEFPSGSAIPPRQFERADLRIAFDDKAGSAASAEVWRGTDALGRDVAVKFFPETPSMEEQTAFQHAKAFARVNHRSVVQIFVFSRFVIPRPGEPT